jgi:glutamyl-tRNA synthetase
MKYIKNRNQFLESVDVKDDALHILATHDDNQSSDVKTSLDKLDDIKISGRIVTRFAPSPTGFLHIGGIRTALYNYLFAKKHGGVFYVRIEDTDQKRFVGEAETYIKNALEWCGIHPDYAPWKIGDGEYAKMRQSERDYTKHTKILLEKEMAYYAFDTDDEIKIERDANMAPDGKTSTFAYDAKSRMRMRNSLSLSKEEVSKLLENKTPYVIRFKTPENRTIIVEDIIRGKVSLNTNQTDDKVLIKSNGIPTYHMANVCDDHDMGTTHVIRGEEWLPSTPLHIMLYEAFGWKAPVFAHLPLILNPDGKGKLSKRKALALGIPAFPMGGEGEDDKGNKVKYLGFKDEGFESEAMLNFLILLGWSPDDTTEIMTMADMISKFSLENVHKAGARFDIEKAKHFNQQHINSYRSDDDLLKHIDMGDTYKYSPENLSKIIDICKKRATFTKDLQSVADIFFKPLTKIDKNVITEDFKKVFNDFIVKDVSWDTESIKKLIFDICAEKGVKMGKIMPSLRMAITGGVPGPDLITILSILSKEEAISRISGALL